MTDIINFARITMLALADSVNPCAFAVLTMVLISILFNNPNKKRKVLFGGLAFVLSVIIGYMFYGIVLVEIFHAVSEALRQSQQYIYDGFAVLAMILGALNIKEFFSYKKGEFATEMPLSARPKVKKIIDKITSPLGAFVIGFLVTVFLLPCTMGPYAIASGLLSSLGFIQVLLWLLYYNLIFVLPMLAIVLLVYFGLTKAEKVSQWKDFNIKILHLIAGLLMFAVGIAILIGWL